MSPDDDVSDALKLMAQVRRLAVTAEDDRLVGVVSQADIALQGKTRTPARRSRAFRGTLKARETLIYASGQLLSQAPSGSSLRLGSFGLARRGRFVVRGPDGLRLR